VVESTTLVPCPNFHVCLKKALHDHSEFLVPIARYHKELLGVLYLVAAGFSLSNFQRILDDFNTNCRLLVVCGEVDAAVRVLAALVFLLFDRKVGRPFDGSDLCLGEGFKLELVLHEFLNALDFSSWHLVPFFLFSCRSSIFLWNFNILCIDYLSTIFESQPVVNRSLD
jgi:hypothetical protein